MGDQLVRSAARIGILAAVALCSTGGGHGAAQAAPAPWPNVIQGSIHWDYAYGQSGEFGYKDFDFSENFSWSGTLTNATPGSDAFARYEATGGVFSYSGTQNFVTTPQAGCDDSTMITRAYSRTDFDKVELQVYLGSDPHAILKAKCGATYHQHTAFCGGSTSDIDSDDDRILGHGDSGNTGVVKIIKGKLDVTFNFTAGSTTGRPYEYERITAHFVLPVPCKVDLDAKGVADADEESVGGLVVRHTDENQAPRVPLTLRRVKGLAGDLLLRRSSTRVKVFTAKKGGAQLAFDGADNLFSNAKLTKTLYVEGAEQSDAMRDVDLTLESVDDPTCKDTVRFTVLWMDPPEFRLSSSETFSAGDDVAVVAAAAQGDSALGFHHYAQNASTGWTIESSCVVHPNDFSYPGVTVAVGHFVEYHDWTIAPGATRHRSAGSSSWFDILAGSREFLLRSNSRDDTPDADGRIYHCHAYPLSDKLVRRDGAVARTRWNYYAKGIMVKGKRSYLPCSDERTFWVRYSVIRLTGGGVPVLDTTYPGDNDAQAGPPQPLTFDFK